ncbi:hypothetical protein LENED_009253 [Lentinula edodes]|uniref:DUF6533 domain-containing protein n=1 Tax=Lentinula edodes TaxID=5353 RepID=A0A1Q3EJA4_LENED|nr:hypothetical protein LENED_009253 [Lentinula edodes]
MQIRSAKIDSTHVLGGLFCDTNYLSRPLPSRMSFGPNISEVVLGRTGKVMQGELDNIETKLQTDIYLHLIAFTFLCYDHVLTFETEVTLIWKRPNTLSSYLFFLNRYFSLIGNIVIILSIFFSTVSLNLTFPENDEPELLNSGIALAIVTDLLASSTPIPTSTPLDGCHDILALKDAALVAVGWEALLLYDLLLFGMTLAKAYQARYQLGPRHIRGMSLISVIIRDGTIYFAIMSLVNFVNVFTFYVTGNYLLRAAFSPITSCLSVTIMSRLMLHLHKIGTQGIYADHAKTIGPISRDQEEYGMTFTTLWSNSDPSATDSSGVGDLSAFEQGSSSGLQIRS